MKVFELLVLQCRAGFEKETAGEIVDLAATVGVYGYCKLEENSGYVRFFTPNPQDAIKLLETLDFYQCIFIRQWMAAQAVCELTNDDRISQIEAHMGDDYPVCIDVGVEHPDTTEGRELATFCKKFGSALAQHFRKKGLLQKRNKRKGWRLMLFVLSGQELYIGLTPAHNSSPVPQGIMRLKFPKDAPSRSTLKLEEAWHWFIPKSEWDERIPMSGTAVDLGAAPGGWTWQLVRRSMFVTAVDNGPMNDDLMASGQVNHLREDAYTFLPDKQVDMMVCDVVDKPMRTSELVVEWVEHRAFKEAIFNLKLPMKQRYQEVVRCRDYMCQAFEEMGVKYELQIKHLYHDREEVTCLLRCLN
ncbi:MAG: 23S rRNA (cytidine(2498)-2'-O)-methyltransferase RlmM [Pontibacterium sp.]